MNKILLLTKILIKTSISSLLGSGKKNDRSVWIVAIVGISLLPILFSLLSFVSTGYDLLSSIQQEGIILSLGVVAMGFIIFFFGVFYVISTFYFSNDTENLIPLPLRPSQIIAAKFIVVVIYEYLVELLLLFPIIMVYGIKSSAGLAYYLYSAIVLLTLPIIPLAFASIIVMIIMRFVNIGKKKDLLKLLGSLLAIAVAVGFNIALQRFTNANMDVDFITNTLIEGNNSFVRIVSNLFPGLSYAATALTQSNVIAGLYDMLIYLLITFALFVVFLYLAEKLYFKGFLGISETDSKKKELSAQEMTRSVTKNPVLRSYVIKEFRVLFRTPVFLLNCVLTNFLWPIFILIPLFTQSGGFQNIPNLGEMIIETNSEPLVIALGFAAAIFVSASNGIASTAISREGENFFTNKYIPLSYSKQIAGKTIPGIILSVTGILVMLIMAILIVKIPVYLALIVLILGILGATLSSMIGITLDIYNPKLVWDSEQKAVKQNLNVLFHLIIGVLVAGLTIFVVIKLKLTYILTIMLIVGFTVLASLLLHKFLNTKGVQVYSELGE